MRIKGEQPLVVKALLVAAALVVLTLALVASCGTSEDEKTTRAAAADSLRKQFEKQTAEDGGSLTDVECVESSKSRTFECSAKARAAVGAAPVDVVYEGTVSRDGERVLFQLTSGD